MLTVVIRSVEPTDMVGAGAGGCARSGARGAVNVCRGACPLEVVDANCWFVSEAIGSCLEGIDTGPILLSDGGQLGPSPFGNPTEETSIES